MDLNKDWMKLAIWAMGLVVLGCTSVSAQQHTVAHQWNEQNLEAIRNDFARPTVHARNLYHASILMYDCWAAYDSTSAQNVFLGQSFDGYPCPFDSEALEMPDTPEAIQEAQEVAISYAMFRLLTHRYSESPQAESTICLFDTSPSPRD